MLDGPNDANTVDDHLLGLRDLSLTATSQFTGGNEATASAIVNRDFDGSGGKAYEAIRIVTGSDTRALVYVRIDDNYDDDPADPDTGNDPLTDQDDRLSATGGGRVSGLRGFEWGRADDRLRPWTGPPGAQGGPWTG